jgi:hypothetical protein
MDMKCSLRPLCRNLPELDMRAKRLRRAGIFLTAPRRNRFVGGFVFALSRATSIPRSLVFEGIRPESLAGPGNARVCT